MLSIIYLSSAVAPISDDELTSILTVSRNNNQRYGITGMLIYRNGSFIQMLEGEFHLVDELRRKISRDPRHCGMVTLIEETISERSFSDWSMGFANLDNPESAAIPGFRELSEIDWSAEALRNASSRARKLLIHFGKSAPGHQNGWPLRPGY